MMIGVLISSPLEMNHSNGDTKKQVATYKVEFFWKQYIPIVFGEGNPADNEQNPGGAKSKSWDLQFTFLW